MKISVLVSFILVFLFFACQKKIDSTLYRIIVVNDSSEKLLVSYKTKAGEETIVLDTKEGINNHTIFREEFKDDLPKWKVEDFKTTLLSIKISILQGKDTVKVTHTNWLDFAEWNQYSSEDSFFKDIDHNAQLVLDDKKLKK